MRRFDPLLKGVKATRRQVLGAPTAQGFVVGFVAAPAATGTLRLDVGAAVWVAKYKGEKTPTYYLSVDPDAAHVFETKEQINEFLKNIEPKLEVGPHANGPLVVRVFAHSVQSIILDEEVEL